MSVSFTSRAAPLLFLTTVCTILQDQLVHLEGRVGPELSPIYVYRHRGAGVCDFPGDRSVSLVFMSDCSLIATTVIRGILIYQNKKLERMEIQYLTAAEEERIRDAARLEGITYEEAARRRRGFRYLL